MEKDPSSPTTGLILGKFMPPHAGHQYLIDFAQAYVSHLTLLVCSLQQEPIPGDLRYRWVKQLYPNANVIHVTDENPSYPEEDPNFWQIWIDTIRRRVPTGPDFVFTSELYGEELAKRLGAQHILVDLARQVMPISGTLIRDRPYDYWQYIPSCVRPYSIKRVVLFGPESTGKTTLARQLAQYYQTVWVPEYARGYLDAKNAVCELTDISYIARGQLASEAALAFQANRVLFCDTDLITTTVWSEFYFGSCPDWIEKMARSQTYDLYLLMDIDVPWVADPQRDQPHRRDYFQQLFTQKLENDQRPYLKIYGSWEQRFNLAVRAVDALLNS